MKYIYNDFLIYFPVASSHVLFVINVVQLEGMCVFRISVRFISRASFDVTVYDLQYKSTHALQNHAFI